MMADDKVRQGGFITYGLYGAAVIVGPTAIAGLIYAYLIRSEATGTYLESHLTWLIRTFWITLLLGFVGVILLLVFVGWIILIVISIWYVYRVVKGFVAFSDMRPLDDPYAWF